MLDQTCPPSWSPGWASSLSTFSMFHSHWGSILPFCNHLISFEVWEYASLLVVLLRKQKLALFLLLFTTLWKKEKSWAHDFQSWLHTGELLKIPMLGLTPRVSDSIGQECGLNTWIFLKSTLGDSDGQPRLRSTGWGHPEASSLEKSQRHSPKWEESGLQRPYL